jgi:VRR-NUC domain
MDMQPEAKLTKKIRAVFERDGARVFKIQASEESHQEVGIPDNLICLWGQFLGIEVKQPGGKLRPLQRVVLHEIFKAGGVAAVVETVEQAELLRSFLKGRSTDEGGLLFYRGHIHTSWPSSNYPLR